MANSGRAQDAITDPSITEMTVDQLQRRIAQRSRERDALTAEIHTLTMLMHGKVMDQPEVRPE